MIQVAVGQGSRDDVLISKYDGKLYATGAYCTYLGSPLSKGALFDDKVVSIHGCGYSIKTGAVELAPALDGIQTFEIAQRDNK